MIHAGTRLDSAGVLRSNGGRVLSATAVGPDLPAARAAAYQLMAAISMPGGQYRSDIALEAAGTN